MERKTYQVILLTLLLICTSTLAFNIQPVKAEGTTLAAPVIVDPTLAPGSIFSIDITVDDVEKLWGYQFILTYDTGVLTARSFQSYDPFIKRWPSEINDMAGYVAVAYSMRMGETTGFSTVDPAPIVWIEFIVDDIGTSVLDLHNSKLVSVYGGIIPHEDVDGFFDNRLVMATVDIDPDTLNLRSMGQWITAYIQLPEGNNPEDIDATTILLNETIQPVLDPKYGFVTDPGEYLVDHSEDGVLERMVKFDRASVESFIYNQGVTYGEVSLTTTGELLDGTPFEGTDVIFVNYAGDVNNDGTIDIVDLSIVNAHWDTDDVNTDFNHDGTVNILDKGILSCNWGQTTPTP